MTGYFVYYTYFILPLQKICSPVPEFTTKMDGYEQPQRPAGHACIFVISYSAYIMVFGSCYELRIISLHIGLSLFCCF